MAATATAPPVSAFQTITTDTSEGLCTITLNRPNVYNAVNNALTTELAEALKVAERDDTVRAIILTGAGKAFCSGQDLSDLKDKYKPAHVPHLGDDLRKRYNPIISRMCSMEKPIIAAVNGVAAGAGCSFALAADIRIASQEATFIEVFINVGLIPDSGSTWFLPRLVGLGCALEMCWTADKITADDALRIGLVNRVVSAEVLMDEARSLGSKLARMPARGIALTKRLLYQSSRNDLAAQLEAEAFAQETAGMTEDHFEGVVAFMEKRKPAFKGR